MARIEEYWTPRIGEKSTKAYMPLMTCFDTSEAILSGAPFLQGSKDLLIQFENCKDYAGEL